MENTEPRDSSHHFENVKTSTRNGEDNERRHRAGYVGTFENGTNNLETFAGLELDDRGSGPDGLGTFAGWEFGVQENGTANLNGTFAGGNFALLGNGSTSGPFSSTCEGSAGVPFVTGMSYPKPEDLLRARTLDPYERVQVRRQRSGGCIDLRY